MGNNFIIDRSFQLIRTNPLLTTNLQIVVDTDYQLYLESINTNKQLSDDKYKHYKMGKESYLEDKIPVFYNDLPINLAFDVKDEDDEDIVYEEYKKQYDTLYWSGVSKVKENEFYNEEYEYFAPLYIRPDDLPGAFIILRVDDPVIYEEKEDDLQVSVSNKNNFRREIIDKWKSVSVFDMTTKTEFGFWLENNYTNNDRFPSSPFEFDSKKYNFSRWTGIDYFTGVYTSKDLYLNDKLWSENPHFRLEKFITEGYKNNELIFPNIANFKFLFDDTPATPFELKKYSLNRYFGFYVDLEVVRTLTPYRSKSIKSGLKLEKNIFMGINQVSGSTMPFSIDWDEDKEYYIFAIDNLYKVIRILDNGVYFYKIISEHEIDISDINRNSEINIIFNDTGNSTYNNKISPRVSTLFFIDETITDSGIKDLVSDLYVVNINNVYHVVESKTNSDTGFLEHFIRTDYGIECNENELTYWLENKTGDLSVTIDVEDSLNKETPIVFKIYKVKFRDIKDFDFNRVDTSYADFDFDLEDEYVTTTEQKLYTTEHRDATNETVFKKYIKSSINSDKIIISSSEYISTDELFEVTKNGLSDIWRKNQSIVKWGYKDSISHSDYPYKLNNSNKVGFAFNRTTDVVSKQSNIVTKTHDYFYRIGNFYESDDSLAYRNNEYFKTQTLSIETETYRSGSTTFDLDEYINSNVDYFDYFFKNTRYIPTFSGDFNCQLSEETTEKDYEETTHYSIFHGGDKYNPSTTLFKGIKYNAFKLKEIIRDDTNLIKHFIIDKNINYNNYKFSVITNFKYDSSYWTTKEGANTQTDVKTTKSIPLNNNENGLHVFVNDKYKNILIIINMYLNSNYELLTLNNTLFFDKKESLYTGKITITGTTTSISPSLWGTSAFTNYDPNVLLANNFMVSLNELNDKNLFDEYVTFYYIDENKDFGYTTINPTVSGTIKENIPSWDKDIPPIKFECEIPNKMLIKRNSYINAAIKGPKYNIYDKYKTDFNETVYEKSFIKEPLARYIKINESEIKPKSIVFGEDQRYNKTIYRYNGHYEPIFKNIELFKPIEYFSMNGYFSQTKCGGELKQFSNTDFKSAADIQSEINSIVESIRIINLSIIKVQQDIIDAENDRKPDLDEIEALNHIYQMLLGQLTIWNTSKSTLEDQLLGLPTNTPTVSVEYDWIFKNRALGLCDGNWTSCEVTIPDFIIKKDTNILELNNFNFEIPLNSTITGIRLDITKKANLTIVQKGGLSAFADNTIQLKNGILNETSDNKANLPYDDIITNSNNFSVYWETVATTVSYGGDGELWNFDGTNNTILTPSYINSSLFSVVIGATAYKNLGDTLLTNIAYIDCVCITINYNVDGIDTGSTYFTTIDRNTQFDTKLYEFGEINELIYSKVNEKVNPLKIKETEEDKSIYPMVDEFGYSWNSRYIFKSSWDTDYYYRTKNEIS